MSHEEKIGLNRIHDRCYTPPKSIYLMKALIYSKKSLLNDIAIDSDDEERSAFWGANALPLFRLNSETDSG